VLQGMWPRLILGGFLSVVGISLFIAVCITPISPQCTRFYGGLALAMLIPGLTFFVKGLKGHATWVKRYRQR
jgi:hypothetical protein